MLMTIPSKFDSIRPFDTDDLPAVYDRLLANPQFREVIKYVLPGVSFEAVEAKMRACKTSLDFQKAFSYAFLSDLLAKKSNGISNNFDDVDTTRRYTFVSNHRDIVLDSALLAKQLLDAGFTTTCEIAIGDNLLRLPWVKDMARLNKAFIVERDLPMRELLIASKRLSEYMHYAINQKHENIWIAQREGRAKDSDDRTQPAILKMMSLGDGGTVIDRLKDLHIVPLSISYELDPCDFLKAKELQQRRDNPDFKKGSMDDVISMQTGIMGEKGRIHYHAAPCLDAYLDTLDPKMPKAELYDAIAEHIDHEIHSHYRLYPDNYVALDMLEGAHNQSAHYTDEDRKAFAGRVNERLGMIDIDGKDEAFLREKLLEMYANPARNYIKANQ